MSDQDRTTGRPDDVSKDDELFPPGSAPRLSDIAAQTGFSVNTVSLALRGSPRIGETTRVKIAEAASRLNYRPNQVAKSLATRATSTVGLVITDLMNPVLTGVARAIERQLSERGYSTLFATSNNSADLEDRMIETFLARRADGILIFPSSHNDLSKIRHLRERNYPIVSLVGEHDSGIDVVGMDERVGAYKATSHLLAIGHRRIALLDGASRNTNSEKSDGYRLALREYGVDFDDSLVVVPPGHDVKSGFWAMEALRAVRPDATAVLASADSLALGAMRYCAKVGLRVPTDIAVMGFDNIEFGEHAIIPLSTVNYDINAVTRLAVERVLDLIDTHGALPPPRVIQIEPDLLIRDSTRPSGPEGQVA